LKKKKKEKILEPIFDHEAPTTQICLGDINYLEQESGLYSYAEYDHILKRYVPEPQPLDLFGIYRKQFEGLLIKIVPLLEKLAPFADDLQKVSQKAQDLTNQYKADIAKLSGSIGYLKKQLQEYEKGLKDEKTE